MAAKEWVVGGGLAQVVGVLLIAYEYVTTRARIVSYTNRSRTVFGSVALEGQGAFTAGAGHVERPEGPPDLLDRIRELEQRVDSHDLRFQAVASDIVSTVKASEERAQRRLESAVRVTKATFDEEMNALAGLVVGLNDRPGHWRRISSVLLLVGGVCASTYGSWLSLT